MSSGPLRETLTLRMAQVEARQEGLDAEVAELRLLINSSSTRMDGFEGLLASHVQATGAGMSDLHSLMEGAIETVTGIANALTVDRPLVEEIRAFMKDQREARATREAIDKQRIVEEIERRKDLRRALSAILGTIVFALGSYIVKQFIPKVGDALVPITVAVFVIACVAFVVVTWGHGSGRKVSP